MSSLEALQMPSARTVVSTAASVAAIAMVVRSVVREYVPHELQQLIFLKLRKFTSSLSSQLTLVIEEFDGLTYNHIFKAAKIYLRPTNVPSDAKRFRVVLPRKEDNFAISLDRNEEIVDSFNGVKLKWRMVSNQISSKYVSSPDSGPYNSSLKSEHRFFELSFHKKHKDMVINSYLPHILEESKKMKEELKTLKLFSLQNGMMRMRGMDMWEDVNFDHPSTFKTLAMDSDIKKKIMTDLERFVERKDYYRKVGKAWKRGYLFFGPPGTGKSSLIAAMANYLKFDVYDLELASIRSNSELRKLLITTANRSILVVEDIDCSIELQNRLRKAKPNRNLHPSTQNEVTLSGLLNFIDGLWSSCGDERIIILTTNHKDRLDPALLRPGRMDVHIHMSFCTPCGFKLLASNYLGITEHQFFSEIEQLIETTKVTPAEIGEELLKIEEPEASLRGLIEFLQMKKGKISDESKKSFALISSGSESGENPEG
ncbi:AAA-ATPase At3g50940-like [Humulus lupulus]|uniref:AAA-ATPase At3g50940-like n=1 Tax=Humulus lupulus TaxID=3486 RepID=UPI002B4042E7|nr:AAA-ATPase At3g50940-like [Humulus lupulus]